jgi:FERM domain-containing protein 3/5
MSEPLGGCMDQVSSVYNPDATLLETVSEETRRHHVNGGESTDHLSDYYFRDSCESGVNNIAETRLGSSSSTSRPYAQTTLLTSDQSTVPLTVQQNIANTMITQNAENHAKSVKKFSIINAFIPSFCFVVIVLIISAVFVLESDSDLFVNLKNWPEMICLRYQYYQPLKEFVAKKINSIY